MIFKSVLKNVISNFKVKKMYKMNYSDQIVRSIVLTTFMKKKFNILFMMFITILLRSFLASLLCLLFSYNLYIDFFLHSLFTVGVVLYSHIIYDVLKSNEHYIFWLLGMLVFSALVGFVIGIAGFIFLFLLLKARLSVIKSGLGALAFLVFLGILSDRLTLQYPTGLLQDVAGVTLPWPFQ